MRTSTWMLGLTLALAAPPALAQPAPAAPDALEIFRIGREAFDRGDYKRALEMYRESQRLAPLPKKLANIARVEARLGLTGSAMRHFQEAVEGLPATDPLRAAIVQEVLDLSPKVPYLRISLAAGAPAGTRVWIDGDTFAPAGLGKDVPIDPGTHVVSATAPGTKERRYEVKVVEGGRGAIEVAPEPAPPPVVQPPVPTPPVLGPMKPAASRSTGWKVGWAAIGVGGASVVTGIATGVVARGKLSTLLDKCPGGQCDATPELQELRTGYHTVGAVSTGTMVAGGAVVVLGAILVATAPGKAEHRAWVAPLVGAGSLGLRGGF